MPVMNTLERMSRATARGVRGVGTGTVRGGRWAGGRAGALRSRVAAGDRGLIRLFDLHATAAAGDTLVAIGLAGTIFFVEPGEARVNVALYLLVTMVPFAVLAPLIGPLLDHVRHGRRYALATTMLGRAVLAWLLADQLEALWLYPAAFGVLVLSRAYGVARAAAVPRLLPSGLTLSQANARGSVYGTLAGLVVLPLGLAAFAIGGGWPLRVAAVIFLVGMVIALRLPARADSDRPEQLPRLLRFTWLRRGRNGDRILTGRLVIATLLGGLIHRALYGFLLIFMAFAIREQQLPTSIAGRELGEGTALGLVSGALVAGTFLAVAGGSRLRIRHPMALQSLGLTVVTVVAVVATVSFTLPVVGLLCVLAAISSGLAKLAVDSSIQERIIDRLRATAFAHSETLLMLAFVAGAGIGLIPVPGQVGIGVAAGLLGLAAVRAVVGTIALRQERLSGRPAATQQPTVDRRCPDEITHPGDDRGRDRTQRGPHRARRGARAPGPPVAGPAPTRGGTDRADSGTGAVAGPAGHRDDNG